MADMLIPDTSIEQPRDDFIWCAPIREREWNELIKLSFTFKYETPGGMRYVHRIGRGRQRVIIVPWNHVGSACPWNGDPIAAHTKEQIEQECAWLRLIKEMRNPIYVVPFGTPLTIKDIIARSMGVSPTLVQSLDSMKEVPDDGNS